MKKTINLLFLSILCIFLSGCSSSNTVKNNITPIDKKNVPDEYLYSLESINDDLNLYTNNKYGFSFKVPKNVYGSAECLLNENGKSYSIKYDALPVKIFEEETKSNGDNTYISTEYFYGLTKRKTIKNPDTSVYDEYFGCERFINTIGNINDKSVNDDHYFYINKFKISTITLNNKSDIDIENFIKNKYGSECSIDSKKETIQKGLYDINIKGTGPEGNCFINYIMFMKYYEPKNILIYGDLGQAPIFHKDESYDKVYDLDIINSIKFTE